MQIHDNGNACKKCDVMVMQIRMPYNGDACKNAMMRMHVRMQCNATHIDVMRKITCKAK